ncbi:MAG: branched-chain amino acid ABC transporter permease [Deltaproteobacteria bacterium]|nr:branched-chain amino acid ABC transporter permease [Deltaproteobacteria bacterium]
MEISFLLQSVINGLSMGSIYALMALGLTLIFGMMHIVNFAHGEFFMLGSFCLFYFFTQFGMNYYVSFVLVIALLFLVGVVLEKIIFRPITGDVKAQIIATLGVSLVLMNGAYLLFGLRPKAVSSVIPGVSKIFGAYVANERIGAMIAALVLVGLLYYLLQKTRLGRACRAVQQNPKAAELQGVNINRINAIGWGLAAALAAAGGALVAPIFSVSPSMGVRPCSLAFVIVIIGGLGSIPGAFFSALIIGIVESFVSTFIGSEFAWGAIFLLAVLIIILRPQGLSKGYV